LTAEIHKKGGSDRAIARSTNRIYDRAYQMTPKELYETYGAEERDDLPDWIQRELQVYETVAGIHLQHHALQATEQPYVDNEIVGEVDLSARATHQLLNEQKRKLRSNL
jgi:ribonucleotide reductase alpha subunit